MGSHMDGRFAQTGRRRPDRRALAAAAVSACALALGALAAVHGREAARGFGAFLKAHVLATAALAQGHQDAAWIAAASLDRYLQSTGRPQIYGTQYIQIDAGMTRGAFDPGFMTDSVRRDTRVPPLAEQKAPPLAR